jgi:hypothetical protein
MSSAESSNLMPYATLQDAQSQLYFYFYFKSVDHKKEWDSMELL